MKDSFGPWPCESAKPSRQWAIALLTKGAPRLNHASAAFQQWNFPREKSRIALSPPWPRPGMRHRCPGARAAGGQANALYCAGVRPCWWATSLT
jgi:hypothetical protein